MPPFENLDDETVAELLNDDDIGHLVEAYIEAKTDDEGDESGGDSGGVAADGGGRR